MKLVPVNYGITCNFLGSARNFFSYYVTNTAFSGSPSGHDRKKFAT